MIVTQTLIVSREPHVNLVRTFLLSLCGNWIRLFNL